MLRRLQPVVEEKQFFNGDINTVYSVATFKEKSGSKRPLLIFIPGMKLSWDFYSNLATHLVERGVNCAVVRLSGHSPNKKRDPREVPLTEHVGEGLEIFRHLMSSKYVDQRQIYLHAYSYGNAIATAILATWPQAVRCYFAQCFTLYGDPSQTYTKNLDTRSKLLKNLLSDPETFAETNWILDNLSNYMNKLVLIEHELEHRNPKGDPMPPNVIDVIASIAEKNCETVSGVVIPKIPHYFYDRDAWNEQVVPGISSILLDTLQADNGITESGRFR